MLKILSIIWETWKKIANFILESIFRVILFIFYFTIFTPFALIYKIGEDESFKTGWHKISASKGEDLF